MSLGGAKEQKKVKFVICLFNEWFKSGYAYFLVGGYCKRLSTVLQGCASMYNLSWVLGCFYSGFSQAECSSGEEGRPMGNADDKDLPPGITSACKDTFPSGVYQ